MINRLKALLACLLLAGCADNRPLTEKRQTAFLACMDRAAAPAECMDAARQLYPDPQEPKL